MGSFRADRFDCFVFDCDGVILDSNGVKSRAFHAAVRDFGEDRARALVEYHQARGGETRQAKFAYFVESILGRSLDDERALVERLVARFGEICREELRTCRTIPGVEAFLEALPPGSRRFVVTGGAQDEVRALLSERKLDGFFDLVLGNPASKLENMEQLAGDGAFEGRGVYFGDAELDLELAERFALDFVYVSGASEWAAGPERCADRSIVDFRALAPSPRGTEGDR